MLARNKRVKAMLTTVWTDWAKFHHLIKNVEPTLANLLCFWPNFQGAPWLSLTKYFCNQFLRVSLTNLGIFFAIATSKKPLLQFYSTRLHSSFATIRNFFLQIGKLLSTSYAIFFSSAGFTDHSFRERFLGRSLCLFMIIRLDIKTK